jgi:hypothetical protein
MGLPNVQACAKYVNMYICMYKFINEHEHGHGYGRLIIGKVG